MTARPTPYWYGRITVDVLGNPTDRGTVFLTAHLGDRDGTPIRVGLPAAQQLIDVITAILSDVRADEPRERPE